LLPACHYNAKYFSREATIVVYLEMLCNSVFFDTITVVSLKHHANSVHDFGRPEIQYQYKACVGKLVTNQAIGALYAIF